MNFRLTTDALTALALLTLGACGGGASPAANGTSSGSGTSAPTPASPPVAAPAPTPAFATAEGLYIGTSSNGRTVTGIVLDNGTYWVIYSVINNPVVIAGAVEGTSNSQLGNFISSDARDFNLEGSGINDATISANYVAKQFLNGTVRYQTLNQSIVFNAQYSPAYDVSPSLATIAGTYAGTGAVLSGTENATLTIDANGTVSGQGANSGCRFGGTIAPHSRGNVYDVSVTFAGGTCSNGASTVTGIGYFDAATRRLYGTALNSTRTNGLIYVGIKP